MLPGIASVDALCADLGIDPGTFGFQVLKASSLLKRDLVVATNAHVIVMQIGAVGDAGFSFLGLSAPGRLISSTE